MGASILLFFGVLIITYNTTLYNFCYLLIFYTIQTFNEFLFNTYYLIGCFIYLIRLNIISFFLGNQYQTQTNIITSQNNLTNKDILNFQISNLNSGKSNSSLQNQNLNTFFLYKTLNPLSYVLNTSNITNTFKSNS
jgi:hypothetical protein